LDVVAQTISNPEKDMQLTDIMFYVFSALALACGLMVLLSRNPVTSVMFLVLTIACLAGLFVLLHAFFLAAIQILVYAGAVMVLFLFVIMLLNLQNDDPERGRRRFVVRGMAWAGGALLAVELALLTRGANVGTAGAAPAGYGGALAVAQSLFTDFLLPFELTSILLLVAVVGAVVLAQKQRRPTIS
jgi:NADH-quinone oxidoreductase subunit J